MAHSDLIMRSIHVYCSLYQFMYTFIFVMLLHYVCCLCYTHAQPDLVLNAVKKELITAPSHVHAFFIIRGKR
jgi:hypothetical protein